jgi:Anti-sigma-K factor rskA/Putative zinc-finger
VNGHFGEDLPALLRGELSPNEAAEVGRHLATCAQCREDLLNTATAAGLLEDMRRLDLAPLPRLRRPRRRATAMPWGWVAATALAVLLVAAVLFAFLGILHGPESPSQRPTATVTLSAQNASGGSGKAQMLGTGSSQRMRITVRGLDPAPGDAYYAVWLSGPAGSLPVGILQSDSDTFALPASLVQGYSAVEVRLQTDSSSGSVPGQSVLRGDL